MYWTANLREVASKPRLEKIKKNPELWRGPGCPTCSQLAEPWAPQEVQNLPRQNFWSRHVPKPTYTPTSKPALSPSQRPIHQDEGGREASRPRTAGASPPPSPNPPSPPATSPCLLAPVHQLTREDDRNSGSPGTSTTSTTSTASRRSSARRPPSSSRSGPPSP